MSRCPEYPCAYSVTHRIGHIHLLDGYQGDVLDADGGCYSAVIVRVTAA